MRKPPQNNFAYLLGGLLLLFLLPPSLRLLVNATVEVELMRALLLVIFSLFTIISVWSLYQEKWVFHAGIALVILNSSTAGVALLFHIRMLELFATISATMFSILSCFIAGRHVFNWRDTNAKQPDRGNMRVPASRGDMGAGLWSIGVSLATGYVPGAGSRWEVHAIRQYFIFQLCDADHYGLRRYHALESVVKDGRPSGNTHRPVLHGHFGIQLGGKFYGCVALISLKRDSAALAGF
jgi:hypothetical protein